MAFKFSVVLRLLNESPNLTVWKSTPPPSLSTDSLLQSHGNGWNRVVKGDSPSCPFLLTVVSPGVTQIFTPAPCVSCSPPDPGGTRQGWAVETARRGVGPAPSGLTTLSTLLSPRAHVAPGSSPAASVSTASVNPGGAWLLNLHGLPYFPSNPVHNHPPRHNSLPGHTKAPRPGPTFLPPGSGLMRAPWRTGWHLGHT